MHRPVFSPDITPDEFERWYWLKSELIDACRLLELSTTGSKLELSARISAKLTGRTAPIATKLRRSAKMPTQFTLDTVIQEGWRCTPLLGRFLREHVGRGFRFNVAVREFVHIRVGEPVSAIIDCNRESVAPGAPRLPLPPQLEYDHHMREYASTHPRAPRAELLDAWKALRGRRRS
jgi:hypothetical protein